MISSGEKFKYFNSKNMVLKLNLLHNASKSKRLCEKF